MSASMRSTRAPPYASAIAILQAVVVLPSSGWALVTSSVFVPYVRGSEHRVLVAADRRHQAEERQLEAARDVLGGLDGVVHVVEAEGDGNRGDQPDGKR